MLVDWDAVTWDEGANNKEKESNAHSIHSQRGEALKEDVYKYFTQTIIGSDNCATTTWIDPVVTGLACVACFMNYTRLSLHRSTSNSASGLMQNKQGLLEWLLSVGINSERPEVRKWSWLTMGSSWRAPHCKYFMSKVKGCVERALKGDKCPKVRGAVACSLGTFVLGLDVNEEGCELVETFIKYLESGLVAECSKEVRREMLIALQHCYKSLPRGEGEERDLEGGSLGQLSATHGTPSDAVSPEQPNLVVKGTYLLHPLLR